MENKDTKPSTKRVGKYREGKKKSGFRYIQFLVPGSLRNKIKRIVNEIIEENSK